MADSKPYGRGIDGVVVINLDRRADRWDGFQATWRDLLPWDRVVRLSASDGAQLSGYGQAPWFRGRKRDRTWAGRGGCALSHARALRLAQARGWDRVLIMEDDAVPTPDATPQALAAVLNRAEGDLIYLGCHEPVGVGAADDRGGVRIHGALDAHAYAVSAPLRDWLIGRMPVEATLWPWLARERAVDRWYRREIGRHFVVLMCAPSLALQQEGTSDITQAWRPADHARMKPADRGASRPIGELDRSVQIVADRMRAVIKRAVGF